VTLAAQLAARKRTTSAASKRHPARSRPIPETPRSAVVEYTRLLVRLSREMDAGILSALRTEGVLRADAADGTPPSPPVEVAPAFTPAQAKRALALITKRLERATDRRALVGDIEAMATKVGAFSRGQWRKQLQAAMGISPSQDLDLELFVAGWRRKNTDLIESLAADKVDRARKVLREGSDQRVEVLQQRILDETGATESRAALIARDQVLKLHADITEAQHAAAGITRYQWSTSRDERVRPGHRELDGTEQTYAKPPIVDPKTGRRASPGTDFQCRCVAIALIPGVDYPAD